MHPAIRIRALEYSLTIHTHVFHIQLTSMSIYVCASHYYNILFSCYTALLYKIFIICSFTALALLFIVFRFTFSRFSRFSYSAKLSQNALNLLLLLSPLSGHPPPPLASHPCPHPRFSYPNSLPPLPLPVPFVCNAAEAGSCFIILSFCRSVCRLIVSRFECTTPQSLWLLLSGWHSTAQWSQFD